MEKKRKVKIALIVLVTSAISVTVCFFCFERVEQILFFAVLLDFFLLGMITIVSGAMLSLRVRKILEDKMKELDEKGQNPT